MDQSPTRYPLYTGVATMAHQLASRLHLDFETASEANLKKTGTYRYAAHPSTRPLMLGWAVNEDPVSLWQPHTGGMPTDLRDALNDPTVSKHAYNAAFERLITKHCLGVDVPYDQWRCTMVESFYLGFAGRLDTVLEAVGLPPKDARGGRLINTFSTPAPQNHKADWYDWQNKPDEWAEFCQYCIQDVHVERQLWHWLHKFPGMHDWDQEQWCLDQSINDRGVPMDVDMAHSAIEMWDLVKESLANELKELMGIPKVTRGPFMAWIKENTGVELEGTAKDYLAALLSKGDLPDEVRPFINLWAQKEGKATSKYTAVINGTGTDGRARGMFQYKGASRTDRVGGRLIQLQNLKRPFVAPESINTLVEAIKCGDPLFLEMLYRRPTSEILGGAIRHVISASPGHTFAVCDLSSVESVVLGWIADCPEIDKTFRAGRDSYKMFAAEYYGIEYGDVTKQQRSFSKPPVLGCGFMLGWRGLIDYAEGYGVDMSADQAKKAVNTFRSMYPAIPVFWRWIYDAVKYVVTTGIPMGGYRLRLERDQDFLRIWLPSGRALSYFKPEVRIKEAPWSTPDKPASVNNFCYMGMNDKHQWVRIYAHAGGVTENIVQSIAGDLLWSGLTNANAAGLPVVLHVHDEIAVEVPEETAATALVTLEQCMTRQLPWAQDMWIGADGFLTKRYTKD